MKIRIFVAATFVTFFLNDVYAQEQKEKLITEQKQTQTWEADQDKIDNDIKVTDFFGLAASSYSGLGISVMHYFSPKYHFKLTGIPYFNRDQKTNDVTKEKAYNSTFFWDAGAEVRRNFAIVYKRNTTIQFYNVLGGGYWYRKIERPFYPEDNKLDKVITGGIGLGIGFIFANKISLNIDGVYQYSHWLNNEKRKAGIGGGISLYMSI